MKRLSALIVLAMLSSAPAQAAQEGKAEKARARPEFKTMDLDADGKVSEKEFKETLPPRKDKKGAGEEKAGAFFRLADKDGDGFLNPEEFERAISSAPDGKKARGADGEKKGKDKKDAP